MKKIHLSLTTIFISILLSLPVCANSDLLYENRQQTTASPVISVINPIKTETSVPTTVYQPGQYEVGVDIPSGEYALLNLTGELNPSYRIYSAKDFSNDDNLIEYCNFMYNVMITLEPGQFLELKDCTASPIDEITSIDSRKGQGYIVGRQIPAGTYRLSSNGNYDVFYIMSRPSTRRQFVDGYSFLTGNSYITVKNGQYLLLVGCRLSEYLGPVAAPVENNQISDDFNLDAAYSPGRYKVGTDIPAGTYILFASPNRLQGWYADFEIRSFPESRDIEEGLLEHNIFDDSMTVSVEDGNILILNHCIAFPVISFTLAISAL